jgi:signal transduction histidine kinase
LKKHEERLEELVKERTQKIQELERQRTEIEKLAAAGLMAARIAHEINNPLAGIKTSFMLVQDAIPQDHPYYKYVGRIDNEINRIARIVRQMFDVYRPEQEIKKEFSVDKTLYEVVALLEAAWRENNVTIEIDSKPITMEMPEGLLRQVLYNILVNAIEASPQGGVVKIMTEVDNEILTLSISDQGVGIPLEVQPRLFEPFFTSKDGSRKGLGLGLAVSKDIVEKLGGHIDFESEPGKGTLFRIILPLKSGERR